MKLKLEKVDGYNVLVDKDAEIKEGDWFILSSEHILGRLRKCWEIYKTESGDQLMIDNPMDINRGWGFSDRNKSLKIIFADKELNIDLPQIPDWEQFEIEQITKKWFDKAKFNSSHIADPSSFKQGYNHNKKVYTEEDLKHLNWIYERMKNIHNENENCDYMLKFKSIIQSLKKLPSYIVVESEYSCCNRYVNCKGCDATYEMLNYRPKLITLPNDKETGIIKEVIWD